MKVQPNRATLFAPSSSLTTAPVGEFIEIVREKYAGKDAAFAVTFEDRRGVHGHEKSPLVASRKSPLVAI
jgi:hypothetical protein